MSKLVIPVDVLILMSAQNKTPRLFADAAFLLGRAKLSDRYKGPQRSQ
jgi:hypothetical protein